MSIKKLIERVMHHTPCGMVGIACSAEEAEPLLKEETDGKVVYITFLEDKDWEDLSGYDIDCATASLRVAREKAIKDKEMIVVLLIKPYNPRIHNEFNCAFRDVGAYYQVLKWRGQFLVQPDDMLAK